MSKNKKKAFTFQALSKEEEDQMTNEVLEECGQEPTKDERETAIGMLTGRTVQGTRTIKQKLEEVEKELQDIKRVPSSGSVLIDSDKVFFSKFANRPLEEITGDPSFKEFCESISRGQAISGLVRPHPSRDGFYEVAYGHRRLTACKNNQQPFLAEIRDLDDSELVFLMSQENGMRKDISAWSLYSFWEHWFDRGWVYDTGDLVERSGYSRALVFEVMRIRKVPEGVIKCLKDKNKISYRGWSSLFKALKSLDREKLIKKISDLPKSESMTYKELIALLNKKQEKKKKLLSGRRWKGFIKGNDLSLNFQDEETLNEVLSFLNKNYSQ